MWIKNILKAFDKDIKIKYYINNTLIEEIETIEQFMDDGLTTYSECKEGELKIEDNTIIIKQQKEDKDMTSKELIYEVRNERGQVRASFITRWKAEKFAEEHKGYVVVKREA